MIMAFVLFFTSAVSARASNPFPNADFGATTTFSPFCDSVKLSAALSLKTPATQNVAFVSKVVVKTEFKPCGDNFSIKRTTAYNYRTDGDYTGQTATANFAIAHPLAPGRGTTVVQLLTGYTYPSIPLTSLPKSAASYPAQADNTDPNLKVYGASPYHDDKHVTIQWDCCSPHLPVSEGPLSPDLPISVTPTPHIITTTPKCQLADICAQAKSGLAMVTFSHSDLSPEKWAS